MTVHVTQLLGRVEDPGFVGRSVVDVPVAWDEAGRRRLRRTATDGTDVTIDLAPGTYLAGGAVLADDGGRILVVTRRPEPALIIRFDLLLPVETLVEQALIVGHAFGNQHLPVEIAGGEARFPLTTSEAIARLTVDSLGLDGVSVAVADVALGRLTPLSGGHAHRHDDAA